MISGRNLMLIQIFDGNNRSHCVRCIAVRLNPIMADELIQGNIIQCAIAQLQANQLCNGCGVCGEDIIEFSSTSSSDGLALDEQY